MDPTSAQRLFASVLEHARRQHGVVSRAQLLALGASPETVTHWQDRARLHRLRRGVYAVGRAEVSRHGEWMAAVLACGPRAALSHLTAAAHWEIVADRSAEIHVSVPLSTTRRRAGIVAHRRTITAPEITTRCAIPVTTPARTLVDLALMLTPARLERAVNEADRRDMVDPERLRRELDRLSGQPGVRVLRTLLDRRTFAFTDSLLEQHFLAIVRRVGMEKPETRVRVHGFRVDFFWPRLGLVVETDGLRYHRTPAEQARDRLRDQTHTAAGLTPLRFTHAQIRYEPRHVEGILATTASRLRVGD